MNSIVHETPTHYVIAVSTGFEVYRNELTHSVRVARIGRGSVAAGLGLMRAIAECNKRHEAVTRVTDKRNGSA